MIKIFGWRGFFRELSSGGNYNYKGLRIEEFALSCPRVMLPGRIGRGIVGQSAEQYVSDSFASLGN